MSYSSLHELNLLLNSIQSSKDEDFENKILYMRNNILNSHLIVHYSSIILKENRKDLLEKTFSFLGKEEFLNLLLKTMNCLSEGGLFCKVENRKRSAGGVFFYFLKNECGLCKKELKNIFSVDYEYRNSKKRVKFVFDKMDIGE